MPFCFSIAIVMAYFSFLYFQFIKLLWYLLII